MQSDTLPTFAWFSARNILDLLWETPPERKSNSMRGLFDLCHRLWRHKLKLIVTCLLCQLSLFTTEAQKKNLSKHITVNQGLPQGYVSGIVQDEDGFMWLGTRDGLARYDGREFKVFRSGDARVSTVSTNVVSSLYRDRKNRIWIFHESGAIDVLDPHKEAFSCFTCDTVTSKITRQLTPNFAYVDSRDNLWLINPDHGFWKINLNSNIPGRISKSTVDHFLSDNVRGIIETPNNQYWVLFATGAQMMNGNNEVVKTVLFPPSVFDGQPDNATYSIPFGLAFLTDELILVRDWHAAFILDTRLLKIEGLISNQVEQFMPNATSPQKDPSGNVIIEIMGSLFQINKDGSFGKLWEGNTGPISFFIDRSGVAWLGNGATGIQTVDLKSAAFRSFEYNVGFFKDIFIQEGVKVSKTDWLNYPKEQRYGHDSQTRSEYDSKNNLWLTNGHHTTILDSGKKTFRNVAALGAEALTFDVPPLTLTNDTCWRVVAGNPVYYDKRNDSWIYPLGKDWKPGKPCTVLDIVKFGNTLWATTRHDGLLQIDIRKRQARWHRKEDTTADPLPTNELIDIELDPGNDSFLWIGTRSGLVRFNIHTTRCQTFTEKHGLPNNTIYCIVPDAANFLWLSTNKGLCKFDPHSFSTQNFSSGDGLQGDEFNFFHKLKLPDGRIAFGGTEGFTVFDPLQIQQDTFQPAVQLTKLRINNEEIASVSEDSIVKTSLSSLSSLQLAYDQNFLTFYFAGLQFNNVGKMQYRYRLRGLDRDWNYAGTLGIVNYTRIPPGSYDLELNATNTAGLWSKNIRRLSITISPPFWKTGLAYALYVCLLIGIVLSYIRYTVKKIRLENLVALKDQETEQLKQLHEVKGRFFTNITHEFRTPLTMIISPLEQMVKSSDLKESHKKQILAVKQNSQQLLQLINQILELSKLEAGLLQVSVAPVNVEEFLEELITPFHGIARHKHLELSFQSEITGQEYFIDKDKLERIVNNLLSNAVKFTPAGGSIKVLATKSSGNGDVEMITLKFIDTGIGISQDVLPLIFDRFYQADDKSNRAYEGTGIGLSLVKELTNLLKGTITVDSTPGRGTTFAIVLPLATAAGAQPLVVRDSRIESSPEAFVLHSNGTNINQDNDTVKPLVMVVEDNDSLRDFLTENLSNFYSVITAANGKEAWEKVASELPELVVTDVMMPYMDGIALSKKIRESEATSHIGLIMLTAKASVESRLEGLQTGANDYISKPFSFDELQLRIANLLSHQKKQREYFYNQLLKNEGARPKDIENEFLKKTYQFIDTALADKKPIGVDDLADHLNMSSRTLNRKLSALLGLTTNELIRNYRLREATTLLRKGLAISEVAYQVGFESSQYFAQCFKALYKVTPTEYFRYQKEKVDPDI
jgi:signal transduction histidine kinase/DNA-binding response OmpR family regulator